MIDPQRQWAIQIDVTNACTRACSNCTRFVGHRESFVMEPAVFQQAAEALADFPTSSPPVAGIDHKVVGIIGGEPLIHPRFTELAEIFSRAIPNRENRGLWTGLQWQKTRYAELIERVFGYVNNNRHDTECRHSPILVAVSDVVEDSMVWRNMIGACWLQQLWSATVTPKGFFFCEIAGTMDLLFDGPGGLPVEPGCWRRPLTDFQEQINRWCPRCGVPLNLRGRIDHEEVDDVSHTNLEALAESPRIKAGKYVLHERLDGETTTEPWRYLG